VDRAARGRVDEFGSGSPSLHGHDDDALVGPSFLTVLEIRPARPEDGPRVHEEPTARSFSRVGVVDVAPRVVVASGGEVFPPDPVDVLPKALGEVFFDRGVELEDLEPRLGAERFGVDRTEVLPVETVGASGDAGDPGPVGASTRNGRLQRVPSERTASGATLRKTPVSARTSSQLVRCAT